MAIILSTNMYESRYITFLTSDVVTPTQSEVKSHNSAHYFVLEI